MPRRNSISLSKRTVLQKTLDTLGNQVIQYNQESGLYEVIVQNDVSQLYTTPVKPSCVLFGWFISSPSTTTQLASSDSVSVEMLQQNINSDTDTM